MRVFEFEVVTLDQQGQPTHRTCKQAKVLIENLGDDAELEMVAIPAGSFLMGSPSEEEGRSEGEDPQHQLNVPSFFMGRYPITQAQWRAVAALPKVDIDLDVDPAHFKGSQRPVETVSWYEAVEFCQRLTNHSGQPYRLPSEAEWEYACRAGTTTPFHFGMTLNADLANYNANYAYGSGVKGRFRQETTPVGSFGVANAFGLSDMHGNVWEWCADQWHSNYVGAPADGSAWLTGGEPTRRLLRGGSWYYDPWDCRSAYRVSTNVAYKDNLIGFRVVCSTLRQS
jgi:formylglycine-generating enzyme required for sulfatase activity